MRKLLLPALLLAVIGFLVWRGLRDAAQAEQEKAAYHKTVDSITVQLAGAKAKVDTLVKVVVKERVRLVHAAARVDTITLRLPAADASGDSLRMIRTRDTVIATLREEKVVLVGHIKTLNEVIAADSGVARLFIAQRETDSLRIAQLEKPPGFRIPLLNLRVKCGPGLGAGVTTTGKIAVTAGFVCVL